MTRTNRGSLGKSRGLLLVVVIILMLSIYFFDKTYAFIEDDIPGYLDGKINTSNKVIYRDGFYYETLSQELKDRITGGSFPKEFNDDFSNVTYDDLRYVRVKYYDFDEIEHIDGEIIVHKLVAQDIVEIFYKLYLEKYPIASIKLVEEFGSSDEMSMRSNNSSAFNYRMVENIDRLSWHAYGLAIDINPLYNPYVVSDEVYPSTASAYVDRTLNFKGKIDYDDLAYKIFREYGWKWGGDFEYVKDYQHFYKEVLDNNIRERKD